MLKASGKLNRFVTIYRITPASDFDEKEDEKQKLYEGWVHMRPASGKEIEVARAMESHVTHALEMNYPFVEIKPQDRIEYKKSPNAETRILEITSVRNIDEADRTLHLGAIEVVHG